MQKQAHNIRGGEFVGAYTYCYVCYMCALDTIDHVHSHSKMLCNALSCIEKIHKNYMYVYIKITCMYFCKTFKMGVGGRCKTFRMGGGWSPTNSKVYVVAF